MASSKKKSGLGVPARRTAAASKMLSRVGKRVELIRNRRALTRKRLAELSGVSLAYLARLEAGHGNISLQLLQQVAQSLGVRMDTLLSEDPNDNFDLIVISEFLRGQSAESLAKIRADLLRDEGTPELARGARISLIGLRGAGKSTIGPLLAKELDRPFLELDTEIERATGFGIREIFENLGQAEFRRVERECLERIVESGDDLVIATAGGIVSEPSTFAFLLSSCLTVYLKATADEHMKRVIGQQDTRIVGPKVQDEARDVVRRTLDVREGLYQRADIVLDTTDLDVDESVRKLVKRLFAYLQPVKAVRA